MPKAAILSLFATACVGSLTGADIDPPDEAPAPPEPITEVTLAVRDGSMPQANVSVLFHAYDDSVIADVVTDDSGRASAKLPDGGYVTIVRTFPPNGPDEVYTYLGVKPGDNLELVGRPRDGASVLVKISVAADPGTQIAVMTPCGNGVGIAPTIDVELKGCGSETEFLVIDNTGPLYFSVHAPIAPQLDFTSETFRGALATELRASNMMMQAQVALQKRLVMNNFTVFDSGAIGTPTATTNVPELPNTQQIVSAYVSYESRTYVVSSRDAFAAAPATIDVGARMVPSSSSPMFAGNTLWWSEVGSGTADLAVASLTVAERQFVRHVAGAHFGNPGLRVPPLPAPYDRYDILPTDAPRIVHNLASLDGGYDAARARVFNHALADIAPIGGSAAASMYSTSP